MPRLVGIFEAKTKLAELCTTVAEDGVEYVITRRGQPVARLVPAVAAQVPAATTLLQRMQTAETAYGPISLAEPDFPDVWDDRISRADSPLEDDPQPLPKSGHCP